MRFLHGDFGEESVPHSHPYEVEVVCRNRELDTNGFSTDIAVMESALEEVRRDFSVFKLLRLLPNLAWDVQIFCVPLPKHCKRAGRVTHPLHG